MSMLNWRLCYFVASNLDRHQFKNISFDLDWDLLYVFFKKNIRLHNIYIEFCRVIYLCSFLARHVLFSVAKGL